MSNPDRGVYEPVYDDDPETFDATDDFDEQEDRGRSPIILLLGLLVLAGFGAVVWLAYNQGLKQAPSGNPPVLADEGPFKVAPAEPGGAVVPHQDKLVYDEVTGGAPSGAEELLPEPETPQTLTPVPAPAMPAPTPTPAPEAMTETTTPPPSGEGLAPITPEPTTPAPALAPIIVSEAPVAEPIAPAESAARAAASGAFVVQVGSYASDALAASAWTRIKSQYGDLIGTLKPDVRAVDLPDKGTWYRLRVGPFDTRQAAADLCEQLKARAQDCLVAKP